MRRLVPQDPNDEPASVLLERIDEERNRLVKEGKVRKQKALPPIEQEKIPYEIPQGWEWVRLGEIGDWGAGATPNRTNPQYYNGTIHWLKTGELNDGYILDSHEKITELALKECSLRVNKPGSVLIAMYGATIGKVGILEIEATTNQACCACSPFLISNKYLFYFLKASRSSLIRLGMGGAQPNISKQKIVNFPFPLPPLNEQKRIVAKVDQLMTFCDRLKETIIQRQRQADRLNQSAFSHLQQAETKEELQSHLNSILNHFNILCTRKEDVQLLRQTILSLAVQGKLVPQNPNDEPASVLLEKIKAEKERLVKEKKIRKEKELPPIKDEEISYEVPEGWEWTKIGNISKLVEYGTSTKASSNHIGVPVLRMNNIQDGKVIIKDLKYVPANIDDLPRLFLKKNDILFNRTNSYELVGKSGLYKGESDRFTFASYLIRVALPLELVIPEYINYYLNSSVCRISQIEPNITQQNGQANFNGTKLKNILIPLPPLNEQKRIVAKLDQLMSLCDRLEEQLEQSSKAVEQLLQSVLKQSFSSE